MTAFVAVLFLKILLLVISIFFELRSRFGDILLEIRVKLSPKRE